MAATFEIIDGLLFVTGSLDRSSDQDFATALEKYLASSTPETRVVDMSNVRWLAPTGAKALIQASQDSQEKGASLRVLASRHVLQTLNLLGAKSWLSIESCLTPNPKPSSSVLPVATPGAPAAPPPAVAASTSAAAHDVGSSSALAGIAPPPASAFNTNDAPASMSSQLKAVISAPPTVLMSPPSHPASSATLPAVRHGALAGPAEELSGGAHLLRVICANRRYSFHFNGGDVIVGIARERIGGAWVMVETAGTRKIVNLDVVQYCEIL